MRKKIVLAVLFFIKLFVFAETTSSSLYIETNVPAVNIFINNQKIGSFKELHYNCLPGQYLIRLEKYGYYTYTKLISLKNNSHENLYVEMKLITGTLELDIPYEHYEITIDGYNVQEKVSLPIGRHQLLVKANGYEPFEQIIFIKPEETLFLSVTLNKDE